MIFDVTPGRNNFCPLDKFDFTIDNIAMAILSMISQ